jgi:methylmalonyl-CoA mutase
MPLQLHARAFGPLSAPWHVPGMTDDLKLGAEFPAATREDWLKLVHVALKGNRSYEQLIARTYDHIDIEPLYPRASHAKPIAGRRGPWQVMARVDHPDPAAANAEALHEVQNGATGLALVFAGSVGAYGYGLASTAEAIARALEGVRLDAIAIELHTAEATKDAADHVAALVTARGYEPSRVCVRFGHDAIGAHSLTGTLPMPFRDLMPRFGQHVASLAKQGFRSPLAAADGRIVHNAGGSEAQELAYTLSVAVAYLRALESAGVALDDAASLIEFRVTADADQFLTIAKLRALRLLWARVEQACGLAPKPIFISAETAWRMMARRDPTVNILRATMAAFSAGVGGADAIAVLPFTAAIGLPDRFARRIARNISLLLLEESNLAKVADPVAGSGGVEDLTEKLSDAAWTLFREIETVGGAPSALELGVIQDKIAMVRAEREDAVAHRRHAITGTSDYPLLTEAAAEVVNAEPIALPPPQASVRYPPLRPLRLAEPFEALRDVSDRILARDGARPKVFLANLGPPSEFSERAHFAKGLFESGGIEAVGNDGFASHDAMIAAFRASGAALACLCSSDTVYGSDGAAAVRALATAGAGQIYVAGRPKNEAALEAAGVTGFVFPGCDALAVLRAAHSHIAS